MKDCPSEGMAEVRASGELRLAASVVTIGAFDGVHQGHQALIGQAIRSARARCLPAVVWTFDPPPKVFFGRAESLISVEEKIARLRSLGPDHVVVARFDNAFRRHSAEAFLAELAQINPALVWAGPDFRFGAGQAGTVSLLAERFPTRILEPVRCAAGEVVSSTRIRSLIGMGAFDTAEALQGWLRPGSAPWRGWASPQAAAIGGVS
jgi:riboflavin kinase/FMN adenylyltransferase